MEAIQMKPINLLAISASPRANGNSIQMLSDTLEILTDCFFPVTVTKYSFSGKQFKPCIGCLTCLKNGGDCAIDDDFKTLRQLWVSADIILYAFPVYAMGMPGQLKCFIDRLGNSLSSYYGIKEIRHLKVMGALAQGGASMGGQELSNLSIMLHSNMMRSIYVSGDGAHVGSGAISGRGGNHNAFREKAVIAESDYICELTIARNMLIRMVQMAAILREGVVQLSDILKKDQHYLPAIARMSLE